MSFEFFRFIKHWRERRESALRAEREHQLAMVNTLVRGLEVITEGSSKQIEESTKGLIEVARASAAQAESFSTWIKSFQITSPPTSSVVTEQDEYAEEQKRLLDLGQPADMTALPEEFKLAFALQNDFAASVRNDSMK